MRRFVKMTECWAMLLSLAAIHRCSIIRYIMAEMKILASSRVYTLACEYLLYRFFFATLLCNELFTSADNARFECNGLFAQWT